MPTVASEIFGILSHSAIPNSTCNIALNFVPLLESHRYLAQARSQIPGLKGELCVEIGWLTTFCFLSFTKRGQYMLEILKVYTINTNTLTQNKKYHLLWMTRTQSFMLVHPELDILSIFFESAVANTVTDLMTIRELRALHSCIGNRLPWQAYMFRLCATSAIKLKQKSKWRNYCQVLAGKLLEHQKNYIYL